MNLKNSNSDITRKAQIVRKLKNSNCDKTQKHKCGQISKTQMMNKLKN